MEKSVIKQLLRNQTRDLFVRYLYTLHYESYGLMGQRDVKNALHEYLESLAWQAEIERG